MRYVDGYVLPVPKKNLSAYRRMAQKAGKVWHKYGALDYMECAADDMNTKWGVPFPKMFKLKSGETLIFSYIVFKSRAHRNSVNAKVMKEMMNDPNMNDKPMPFDVKRMVYGGFKVIVEK
ncbi:MAG TPA: DUF1428 domain-containing protein [Ignavibacteria bacterium]|jgi:uncharacterized protein YbaA (DUF1428 family)